ncbi:MAG: sulfatase, partial [Candidatus Hydrogenedentes bacterium]|nr:sulfatase [Candidatus Hydrogenedentota bacterium]
DTLRADRLGCYGHALPTSPHLDAFAKDALLFEDCVTEIPLTSPAFSAMMTSQYPRMNGVARNGLPLPPGVPTLAEQFKTAGYETACVTSNWTLKAELSGLHRGFDHYDDGFRKKRWGFLKSERYADEVTRLALERIEKRAANKPLFAWFHYSDPHAPYRFHSELNPRGTALRTLSDVESTRARYDSEVAYTDLFLGKLFAALPKDNAIVVFVADHGESLYEHEYLGHGRRIYQDSMHVPLIVRGPGVTPGRSKTPARMIDVAPTLLALAGLQPLAGALGLDLINDAVPANRPRVVETYGGAVPGVPGAKAVMAGRPPMRQGVIVEGWKLVLGGPDPELFHIATDKGEIVNLYRKEPGRVAAMRSLIEEWDANVGTGSAEAADLTEEDVDALKSLGYVE